MKDLLYLLLNPIGKLWGNQKKNRFYINMVSKNKRASRYINTNF